MSACPIMMSTNQSECNTPPPSSRNRVHSFNNVPGFLRGVPPTSPILKRSRGHTISTCPGSPYSPTIRVMMHKNDIPSIATTSTSSTSPLSPTTKQFTFQSPPPARSLRSSLRRKRESTAPSTSPGIVTTVSSPTDKPSSLPLSCNNRMQPVAKTSKVKLGPGCSIVHWIKLCRSNKDLAGTGGVKRPITPEELALHNTEDDAWTAIRGKVYNITPYMKFHPGGREELMKGAGIDCTIIFEEVHQRLDVDKKLSACYLGPLVASPNTQRRGSIKIIKNARRRESLNVSSMVPSNIIRTDEISKQVLSTATQRDSIEIPAAIRKNSMELRTETQAATACEEPDGLRQVSPESPVKPMVGYRVPKKSSTASVEAAEHAASIRLSLPPVRIRRTSEPHPRFDWVQSEKAVIIHVLTPNLNMKSSDVVIDVNRQSFEAAIFINDWVFEINIELAHAVISSQVAVDCSRVEISLKKEVPHQQWESIGTFGNGHARLNAKSRRGTKYHSSHVESIKTITHDTKLFTLRLPTGSYLNVPTGHHLSIKANVAGEDVERSYTPVSTLEGPRPVHPQAQQEGETIELMIKLYKDGKMSSFLDNLEQGDEVMLSDPEGTFDAFSKLTPTSDVLLIAAGSGFTPMVKVLRDFMSSEMVSTRQRIMSTSEASGEASEENQQAPELPPLTNKACDCSEVVPHTDIPKTAKLFFANKKEKDVMWKEELEHLKQATAERFTVTHILSAADKSWGGMRGRISETLLRTNLPAVSEQNHKNALVCVCGPEPFTANISNMLLDLEFPDECIHVFQ